MRYLPAYRRWAAPPTLFVSIMAGKTIAGMTRHLGPAALVRTMPNTPAAIGRGIAVACANGRVTPVQRRLCDELLAAAGETAWVEDEALLDAVTAVSGSGPAYVFLLIEALAQAGEAAGLPARAGAASGAQHRGGLRRTGPPVRREPGTAARGRDEPRRHDARRARRADGGRRSCAADWPRGRRGGGALARIGGLSRNDRRPDMPRSASRSSTGGGRGRNGGAEPPGEADRIIDAALACIARDGWRRLSLAAVATEAGLPVLRVYRNFRSKQAILRAFLRRIDEAVLAEPPAAEDDERPRDRLFDLLMRRFDALRPYKPALSVLRRELPTDPPSALCAAASLICSMRWMLEAADIAAGGVRGAVAVKLTAAAYLGTARVWQQDDAPDLGQTMAALDGRLRRIERWLMPVPAVAPGTGETPPPPNFAAAQKTILDVARATADILGVVQRTISHSPKTHSLNGTPAMDARPNFFDFDVTKMMADFRFKPFDVEALMACQRRNIEALSQANQLAVEGVQAVARRQIEIARQTLEDMSVLFREMTQPTSSEDRIVKNTEYAKQMLEKSVTHGRELTLLASKAGAEAADVLRKRACESLDELREMAKHQSAH